MKNIKMDIIKLFKTSLILIFSMVIFVFIPYFVGLSIEYVLPSTDILTSICNWIVGFFVLSFISLSMFITWLIYSTLD